MGAEHLSRAVGHGHVEVLNQIVLGSLRVGTLTRRHLVITPVWGSHTKVSIVRCDASITKREYHVSLSHAQFGKAIATIGVGRSSADESQNAFFHQVQVNGDCSCFGAFGWCVI
jgi:hypothetical protein